MCSCSSPEAPEMCYCRWILCINFISKFWFIFCFLLFMKRHSPSVMSVHLSFLWSGLIWLFSVRLSDECLTRQMRRTCSPAAVRRVCQTSLCVAPQSRTGPSRLMRGWMLSDQRSDLHLTIRRRTRLKGIKWSDARDTLSMKPPVCKYN